MNKKYIGLLLGVFIAISAVFGAQTVSAHELLPKVLVQYINEHPDATPAELEAFMEENTPEFATRHGDRDSVLKLIRNQGTNSFDNAFDFLKLGIHHILSGPDHILFVLSLLLIFVSIKQTLKLTFAFTVAHSITLVLAGAGLITLSTHITEPLIALSISFVAITTVFFKNNRFIGNFKTKVATVFFFGLFHGLGFAGLLEEIHIPKENFISSLFSFNVGIELGQLVIVALALPLIYLGKDKHWYGKVIKTFAVIIAVLGILWAFERITDIQIPFLPF